jgi:predicted amidohydrolase
LQAQNVLQLFNAQIIKELTQNRFLSIPVFMGVIKVSIFQKSLPEGLNLSIYKKLSVLKSDFLIFPEYFYADSSTRDFTGLADKSQYAADWLHKLNDVYKGIIIGGSIVRQEENNLYSASSPIIYGGSTVDWYKKRNLSSSESAFLKPGNENGSYILGGHRFGVFLGSDITIKNALKELADQGIRLVFSMHASHKKEETPEEKNARDEQMFVKPASELGLYIVKCSATGQLMGQNLQGRSMVVSPAGISWRVAPHEENNEIIKTVMINLPT